MSERLVGVCLSDGTEYPSWNVALGQSYPNIADGIGNIAVEQYDQGVMPFPHVMFHETKQPGCTIEKIAAGDYNDLIDAWLLELKAYCDTGRTAVVVYLPEMNGDWTVYGPDGPPDWGANPEAFKWAFNWFVLRARDHGLTPEMVKFMWAPNNYGWGSLEDWWPGDLVDMVGMSAYNWGGLYSDASWLSPRALLDPTVAEVRRFTDKPLLVTQTAAGLNDPRTPQWLDDLVDYTQGNNIEGFIWFNIGEFEYGPGVDDFNARTGALESARPDHWFQIKEDDMGSRAADNALGELQEAFPDVRAGVWNCRKIAGTSTWSQHSWGNALDLHHVGWPYEVSDRNYAFLDPIYDWLKTYQEELSIRVLLWRVKNHHDHIHLDFWPKGYGQPPCDGGSLRMQYNDGRVVNGDPGPANGLIELPDKELITMSDAQVLEKGMSGVAVADLQKMLIELDYDLGQWPSFGPGYPPGADGEYGQATVDAVTAYQEQRQLVMTGKADGVTLFYIREDLGYAGQGELYPHEHGFVVNIPSVTITSTTEEA